MVAAIPDELMFWLGFESQLKTLALYSVGIAVYGLFIFFFYERLSRRNLLGERFQNPGVGWGKAVLRGLRYLIVFPAVTFAFFVLLSFSFFFLSTRPEGVPQAAFLDQILLISMAVVTSVRITAYISENTSHDIAKLLPLGLLGVYLVNVRLEVDVIATTWQRFQRFLSADVLFGVVARYFVFLLALESVLRIIYLGVRPKGEDGTQDEGSKEGLPRDRRGSFDRVSPKDESNR